VKKIHVNQLGYTTKAIKKAVVPQGVERFEVVRAADGVVIFEGAAGEEIFDAPSDEVVRVADFSAVDESGEYIVRSGGEESFPFPINDNPYAHLRGALLDFFHYQKCGVDLECGEWSHPACHTSLATVWGSDEKKEVSGGWHDAGDYGRYVVPAGMTVAGLLLAYEMAENPDPTLPDIVWFEIEWLLKMQCERTGGVYHKVTCERFNPLNEMPHLEENELYLSPISATATADFAATMALAARFYPSQKTTLLNAANRAWGWLEANPNAPNFTNPEGIRTGEYGDKQAADEIFWAACELFAATGDEKFHDHIKANGFHVGLGWADMRTYGLISYLSHAKRTCPNTLQAMKHQLSSAFHKIIKTSPYGVDLGATYRWGSNLDVANDGITLLLATRFLDLSPHEKEAAKSAAFEHFHYLLGKNPLSQSYVSGFGANPMKYPHHRPSVAIGKTVPGMVAGGPCNTTTRDATLQDACEGSPPAKFYTDQYGSFASNEVTIYWNSAVYWLLALL
jgi:endoglucanase